jgi:YGGT family
MGKSPNKYTILRSGSGITRVIATIFSIIEMLLVFRFILKLLGANAENGLIQGLYDITQPLIGLFEGIFATMNTNIFGILGVFEPATVIAVVVFSFLEWALLKLVSGRSGRRFGRNV